MKPHQLGIDYPSGSSPDPPAPPMDEKLSVILIEALAAVWSRIRSLHLEVPSVVLLPAPARRGRLNVLGHFAALRWSSQKAATSHHEVVVVAEHLNRPAEDIVETLIHEAAHALNFEKRIHDCSASQYHNRQFKAAAEELGLTVEQVPNYGFAATSLPDVTARRYQAEIEALREVLIHRNRPVSAPPPPPPGNGDDDGASGPPRSRLRKAICACPFIVRVSRQTMVNTVIRCERCGEPFRLV